MSYDVHTGTGIYMLLMNGQEYLRVSRNDFILGIVKKLAEL